MRWGIRMSREILYVRTKIRMLVRLFSTHWVRANIRRTVQLISGRDRFLRDVVRPLQDDRAPDRGNGQDQRKRRLPQGVKIGRFLGVAHLGYFLPVLVVAGFEPSNYHCTVDLLLDWFWFVCFANKNKIVSSQTADSKPVKQEVSGTVMFPPLVFLG